MATNHFLLNVDLYDSLIGEFFISQYPEYKFEIKKTKSGKLINFTSDGKKENSGQLTCYFPHGKCSFNPQGKLNNIAKELQDYIVEHAALPDVDHPNREIVYHKVPEETIDIFLSFIKEKYTIDDKGLDKNNDRIIIVYGPYSSSVVITRFHTGTVLVQGVLTSLLIDILYHLEGVINEDKEVKDKCFIEQLSLPSHKIIDSNLSAHFPDRSHFDQPIEDWLSSTIILLNAQLVLPDYTCVVFGALKALEGVMAKRFGIEHPYSKSSPNLGCHFQDNPIGSKSNYTMTTKSYDSNVDLKVALEVGYNHYFNNRHALFHVDAKTIAMTRTIPTLEEALDLTVDTFGVINSILINW